MWYLVQYHELTSSVRLYARHHTIEPTAGRDMFDLEDVGHDQTRSRLTIAKLSVRDSRMAVPSGGIGEVLDRKHSVVLVLEINDIIPPECERSERVRS